MIANIMTITPLLINYSILLAFQLTFILLFRKKISAWFGATTCYRLWLLPILWLPFYLISWSSFDWSYLSTWLNNNQATASIQGTLIIPTLEYFQFDFSLPTLNIFSFDESSNFNPWITISIIWLTGTVFLLTKQGIKISQFNSFINSSATPIPNKDVRELLKSSSFNKLVPVCYLKGISGPALFGILHPVLLLPDDFMSRYDADQRHIILSHEAVHLRRKDNIWNMVANLFKALFWTNPLVHYAYRYFRLDQELSCDAIALKHCNSTQSKRYALTLLKSAKDEINSPHPQFLTAWDNLHELKERTHMIKQHLQKKNRSSLALMAFLIFTLLGGSLTSCVSKTITQNDIDESNNEAKMPPRSSQIVSKKVYSRIESIMELQGKENYDGALAILDELKTMAQNGRLNAREEYTMWLFYASLQQDQQDYTSAINSYKKILALPTLTQEQKMQTLVYTAALYLALEDYQESLNYYTQHAEQSDSIDSDNQFRMAAAYYQLGNLDNAILHTQQAINHAEEPSISHYELIHNLYWQQGDYSSAKNILEQKLALFNQAEDQVLLNSLNSDGTPARTMELAEFVVTPETLNQSPSVEAKFQEMLPIFTKQPVYPRTALEDDIEGWVMVQFIVTTKGEVKEPFVVDASKPEVFSEPSLAAIAQFKFNPRVFEGKPVEVPGVQYVFRYSLSN